MSLACALPHSQKYGISSRFVAWTHKLSFYRCMCVCVRLCACCFCQRKIFPFKISVFDMNGCFVLFSCCCFFFFMIELKCCFQHLHTSHFHHRFDLNWMWFMGVWARNSVFGCFFYHTLIAVILLSLEQPLLAFVHLHSFLLHIFRLLINFCFSNAYWRC